MRPGRTSTVRLPRPRSRACSSMAQPLLGRRGDERRADGGGDRALAALLDLGERQRERRAFLGERPRRRRQALALGDRALERGCPGLGDARPLEQAVVDRGRRLAQPLEQRLGRLAAELQALGPAAQPVQRGRRSLAAAGRLGQRILGAGPLGQDRLERLLGLALLRGEGRAARVGRLDLRGQRADVERRDPGAEAGDLDAELLRALGGRRLQGQRAEPLRHLRLDVARALDLDRDPRELQLGAMTAALELPEAGRLLDERPALLRLRGEDRLHAALRDDRAHRRAEPDVGEQLDDVGAADVRAVDEVLALAAPVQAADDRDLGVVELAARRRPRCRRGARPRSGRPSAGSPMPAKRTSSGFSARSSLGASEPAAQISASAMFDLPEPFGPTTTATPGSRRTSTGSGNDLKPRSLIARRCTPGGRLAGGPDEPEPA